MGKHLTNIIPIAVYDRATGELVNTYSSATVAARRMGIKTSSYILRSCRKNPVQLSVGNHVFRFIEGDIKDVPKQIDVSYLPRLRRSQPVALLDKDKKVVAVYESMTIAAKCNFISPSGLTSYLRHEIRGGSIVNENRDWRVATQEDILKYGQIRCTD